MGTEISRHWRLNSQRYQLIGEICPHCDSKIFPTRDVCPGCTAEATIDGQTNSAKDLFANWKVENHQAFIDSR